MILTKEEWFKQGISLYGKDTENWEFKCPHCKRVQSAKSIREQLSKGIGSMRHGLPKKGDPMHLYSECYSPECNWVAYGLFSSGIIVIHDSTKPYNIDTKENCGYVFPFSKEAEP